jgi:hypothetical protein
MTGMDSIGFLHLKYTCLSLDWNFAKTCKNMQKVKFDTFFHGLLRKRVIRKGPCNRESSAEDVLAAGSWLLR